MSSLASPAYTDGLSLDTRGCRSSLKSPVTRVSKTLSEALLCDSPLDDRSLTPPARQGTKEGPTPSPPEVTAPHQCLCGLPGRDGRRGTSARGDASSPYPRGSPPPRPGRPRAGRHGLRRRERPSRRPRRRHRPPPPSRAAARRPAAGCGRPWRCCCPTAGSAPPTRSWGSPRTTRPRARARPSRLGRGRVVGLGCVPIGPGMMFLSALGEPGHFPAADVIRRPLGTLARGRLDTPPSRTRRDEIDATRTAIRAA